MSDVINRECIVQCKKCGSNIVASWKDGGFLSRGGWQLRDSKGSCPICHARVDLKDLETVICPHCGKLVKKNPSNKCPSCSKNLEVKAIIGKVKCPRCAQMAGIPEGHSGSLICVCGNEIPQDLIEKALRTPSMAADTPQYIQLPGVSDLQRDDYAIWKYPLSTFSYKSRMQVNEGTYALFLQNGVCREPRGPGQYLLEALDLSTSNKLDAAMSDESIVFNTDIFCVLQDLPDINWGALTDPFESADHLIDYSASANGSVSLKVCEPKAYAQYIGFKPVLISELVRINNEAGSTDDGPLIRLVRDMTKSALYGSVSGIDSAALDRLTPYVLQDRLVLELNRALARYGLCVKSIRINGLRVNKTEKYQAMDAIRDQVRSEQAWNVQSARLFAYGNRNLYADIDFSGVYRLELVNESRFFSVSEIKAFLDPVRTASSNNGLEAFFSKKISDFLKNELVLIAQDRINSGEISDIVDGSQYAFRLRDRLTSRINMNLNAYGLAIDQFTIDIPSGIRPSEALTSAMSQPDRRETVRRAAESVLRLATEPILVHTKNDASIYLELVFSAQAGLRVWDENAFFGLSEIRGILEGSDPISVPDVQRQYAERINPIFNEVMSRTVQSAVDQTNADIREVNRLSGMLKNVIQEDLSRRVGLWGLRLEALDMYPVRQTGTSNNFERMIALENTKSGSQLENDMQRILNDNLIFQAEEQSRVATRRDEIADETEESAQALQLRRLEREQQIKIASLNKGAELDKLVDEIAEAKHARTDEAVLQDYKRQYRLRETQLNDQYAEARRHQQELFALENAQLQHEFDQKMAEAESQRAINDIMHRIADSDLSWQQKLDEYSRLRRLSVANADAEIRQLDADTEIRILRTQNEAYYQIGSQKIKLEAEQAELLERINRYAEERNERQRAAEDARQERQAVLDFKQRMEERRDRIALEIEKLSTEYAHEEKLHAQDIELEKVRRELEYSTHAVFQAEATKRVEAEADAKAKVAAAEAEAKRLEAQLDREEGILKRAEEFRTALMETMKAIEMARIDVDKTVAAAAPSQEEIELKYKQEDLEKKLKHIDSSVSGLRDTVNQLRQFLNGFAQGNAASQFNSQGGFNQSYGQFGGQGSFGQSTGQFGGQGCFGQSTGQFGGRDGFAQSAGQFGGQGGFNQSNDQFGGQGGFNQGNTPGGMKPCPQCGFPLYPNAKSCPKCNYIFF